MGPLATHGAHQLAAVEPPQIRGIGNGDAHPVECVVDEVHKVIAVGGQIRAQLIQPGLALSGKAAGRYETEAVDVQSEMLEDPGESSRATTDRELWQSHKTTQPD